LTSPNITDIRFNKEDTCVAICTQDGYVHRFLTKGGLTKLNDGGFSDKTTAFSSISFPEELGKETDVVAVGTDGMAGQFRVIDNQEMLVQTMQGKEQRSTAHAMRISD